MLEYATMSKTLLLHRFLCTIASVASLRACVSYVLKMGTLALRLRPSKTLLLDRYLCAIGLSFFVAHSMRQHT
jgi:hypothetical protein